MDLEFVEVERPKTGDRIAGKWSALLVEALKTLETGKAVRVKLDDLNHRRAFMSMLVTLKRSRPDLKLRSQHRDDESLFWVTPRNGTPSR